jgi:hypothetical protein
MKKQLLIFFVLILSVISFGEDNNLLQNGDFSKGSKNWHGDIRVTYETSSKKNKVCIVKIKDESFLFYQYAKPKKRTKITLHFRVKRSADYVGKEKYQVRFWHNDRYYTWNKNVPKQAEQWKDVKIKIPFKKCKYVKLEIRTKPGVSGFLYFDDFKLIEK